jgi:hypothetical protein
MDGTHMLMFGQPGREKLVDLAKRVATTTRRSSCFSE